MSVSIGINPRELTRPSGFSGFFRSFGVLLVFRGSAGSAGSTGPAGSAGSAGSESSTNRCPPMERSPILHRTTKPPTHSKKEKIKNKKGIRSRFAFRTYKSEYYDNLLYEREFEIL